MLRWEKILDEATRQAGSASSPVLLEPVSLMELDPDLLPDCRLAAMLSSDAQPLSMTEIMSPAAIGDRTEETGLHPKLSCC